MPLFTLTRHGGRALLATAALVLFAACGDSPAGPSAPQPSADANASEVLRLNLSSTTASFVQPTGASALPKPIVIIASNAAALIPSTGIQVTDPIYANAPGWLTVTPKILGLTASITLQINPNNLVNGGYTATFTVKVPGTTNSPVKVTVFYAKGFYYTHDGEEEAGWSLSGLWHRSMLTGICNDGIYCLPSPETGTKAWYYGSDATGDFDFGNNAGDLTSPAFSIPNGAVTPLWKFRSAYEGEGCCTYDQPLVYVVDQYGSETFLGDARYNYGTTMPSFVTQEYDLSPWIGQTVRLRFRFRTGDGILNNYRGWIVDRIVVAEPAYFTAIGFPPYTGGEDDLRTAALQDPFRVRTAVMDGRR